MEPFVIKRSEVAAKVGACELIGVFDMILKRAQGSMSSKSRTRRAPHLPIASPEGDIVYENGWQEENTQNLLNASPRAFWLMARAGLIPVSEKDALQMILSSGKQLEPVRHQVSAVRHVTGGDSIFVLRARVMLGSRLGRTPPRARTVNV